MARVAEVLLDFLPRIEAAADELDDAKQLVHAATLRRNMLIIRAVDAGVSQRAVAKAARVGQPRIIGILGTPLETDADDGDEDGGTTRDHDHG